MLFNVLLGLLIVFSVAVVSIRRLRVATIFFAVCSMLAAIVFLFLGAPDVALAQAVIGCTLSTIILLVGIRKYRVYDICILPCDNELEYEILDIIDTCATKKELEAHHIRMPSLEALHNSPYDIAFQITQNNLTLYGEEDSYILIDSLEDIHKAFPDLLVSLVSKNTEVAE